MRTLLLPSLLAAAAVLAVLPTPAGALEGDLALTGGIPLRLAGDASLRADAASYLLTGSLANELRVDYTGATVRVLSVHSEYSVLPTGDKVRMDRQTSETRQDFGGGLLRLDAVGPGFYLLAQGRAARLESQASTPSPNDAWTQANLQFSSLIQPRLVAPPVASSLADLVEDPATSAGAARFEAGTYETRAPLGRLEIQPDRLVLFDAAATVQGVRHESRLVGATQSGGVWVPATRSWTGPGEHYVEDLDLLVVETAGAHLAAAGSRTTPLLLYSSDALLSIDGYAQFPWAMGQLQTASETIRVDGEQVLLGGQIQLRALGVDHDRVPSVSYLGTGELALLQVGPLPEGPTAVDAAIVAGSASAAAIAMAATVYYWPLVKYSAGALFAPLYARLPRDKVLDHKGRSLVYDFIRNEPGISTHRLASCVEFGWSTLMYHLRVLERTEKIVSVRDGRYKRFFDRESGRYANGRKVVVAVLKNEATLSIGRIVLESPGITQKELSERLGLAPSSIHWHVERLSDAGLLEKRRDGHNVRYYPGPAWKEVQPEDVGLPAQLVLSAGAAVPAPAGAGAAILPPLAAASAAPLAVAGPLPPGPALGPLR